jgi:hypothetical protein
MPTVAAPAERATPRGEQLNLIEGLLEQVWAAQQQTQGASVAEDAQPPAPPTPTEGAEEEKAANKARLAAGKAAKKAVAAATAEA